MMKKTQLFLLTLLFLLASILVYGQGARKYDGYILDASTRNPLAGVSVKVKNSVVQTDEQGKFVIQAIQGEDLSASLLGYEDVSINLTSVFSLEILMSEVSTDLESVVVIGYGTAKKSDLTGSVVRISMKDKALQANTNLLQSLIGATSGVNLESRGGASSEPSLSIRGQTSLSASDRPLIVLDGVIYNGSINNINMNDVEAVDILKDASSAAVYGSRAANGVLLITTKKGKTDKPVIAFNTYAGLQNMTNNPMRVMDGEEFAMRLVDWDWQSKVYNWYKTNPTDPSTRPVRPDVTDRNIVSTFLRTLEEQENYLAGNSIDWVDEVLQTAPMQYYNVSLQGKSDHSNYYLSGSYSDIEGIQINDRMKRLTLHSNIETKVNDWLKINLNTSFSNIDNSGIPASLATARKASPLVNNNIGQENYDIYLGGELFQPYPLVNLYIDNSDISKEFFGLGAFRIDAPWVKGLAFDFNYSYIYSNRNNNTFNSSKTPAGVSNRGAAVKSPSEGKDWAINNILSYNNTFGKHQINSTLLLSTEGRNGSGSTLNASGFSNEILGYNNMGLGEVATVTSSAYKENSISYMARANYSFMSRYLFTATIRRDGFSGFGVTNKWANFPSASLAWVMSEEPFFKPENVYLKIRTSYGKNGNQGIGRYSSQSRMGTRDYVYGQNTAIGIYPSTLGNIALGWETTSSFNTGIDFGFMQNRITGSLDLYSSKTSDILVKRKLPRMAGYADIWTNIGATSNKGIELDVKSINLKGAFRWETNLTFGLNRDKLTRLYGDGNDRDIGNAWFVGKSLGAIYDYQMAGGVWTEEEFFNGDILEGWYPGQFKYVDQGEKDNVIDPTNDRTIIGYTSPSYRFSVNNTFSYQNFSLSIFINSIQGGSNRYLANNAENVNPLYYFPDRHNNSAVNPYWSPLSPTTNTTGIYNVPLRQSGIYQSRSFVRIQDISLGYSFKNDLLKKLKMQTAQVYISSKNPYVWTKWQGWDPESGASDTPVMRNVVLGLNVSF